jgi:NAD(P)-dependent dehydrogenase (short-subunit alcohol dehydrogenase family)
MQLTGRTALVTGASRGIGRAIALALAEEGADVAVNYLSSKALAGDVVDQIRKMGRKAVLAQANVADYPDTARMAREVLEEFGHLDILINNAGITSDHSFVKMDPASWKNVLAINLDGPFNCTKVLVDQMIKQSWGRIVNITSVIGQIGNFGQANYAASKAGLAAFTKSEMVMAIPEKVRNRLLEQIPMKRFGRSEEVARACVYLCSKDGDYITGAELSINGGLFM